MTFGATPRSVLTRIAAMVPEIEPSRNGAPFDPRRWLESHGKKVTHDVTVDGTRKLTFAECPFHPEHGGSPPVIFQHTNGSLFFRCLHNRCSHLEWNDLRKLLEPERHESSNRNRRASDDATHGGDDETAQDEAKKARKSQATLLLEIMEQAGMNYVHDASGTAYAVVPGDAPQVYPVKADAFRSFLADLYFTHCGRAPGGSALTDARYVMQGMASRKARRADVHLRYANVGNIIDVDLGTESHEIVRVTSTKWEIIKQHQRLFKRTPAMLELPHPIRGGSIDELRSFFHVDEENFVRLLVVMVNAMRGVGPFPIGVFTGPQGSSKTVCAVMVKTLIDPSKPPTRAAPSKLRDLAVAAANGYLVVFDNLSKIPDDIADGLCRLSTGGGFGTRLLYSDEDEKLFDAQRPVILTGIVDLLGRPDMADRAMLERFSPIDKLERKAEQALYEAFDEARPRLLGALLDALVVALANIERVSRSGLAAPRMADAYYWSTASEPALGRKEGAVHKAWTGTHADAVASAIEASPIAEPLLTLLERHVTAEQPWVVSASGLLEALNAEVSETVKRQPGWPKAPRWVGDRIDEIVPALRELGYAHEYDRTEKMRKRIFARMPEPPAPPTSN